MSFQAPLEAGRLFLRLLLTILGFGLLAGSLVFLLASRLSTASYATTTGYVVASYVSLTSCRGATNRGRSGEEYPCYRPEISYRYTVAGRDYSGDGLYDDSNYNYDDPVDAAAALAPFQRATVTVYYLPSNPERSALVIGAWNHWIWIVGGIGLLLVAAARWFRSAEPDDASPDDAGVLPG